MKSAILGNTKGLDQLPKPYCDLPSRTTNKEYMSVYNQGQRVATLYAGIVKALICYFQGEEAPICLVKISDTSYAAECELSTVWKEEIGGNSEPGTNNTLLINVQTNGSVRGAILSGDGTYTALPNLLETESFDTTPFLLALLPVLRKKFNEVEVIMERLEADHNHCMPFRESELYRLSDSMYRIFTEQRLETDMQNGCVEVLNEQSVTLGGMCYNEVLCGTPKYLQASQEENVRKNQLTVADAKKEFQQFSAQFYWEADEADLIPVFPEDFAVPEETLKMARRYVGSRAAKRPMVNFMWRGVTAYGKSTGVEILACILHMPLLRVTCHSNMETQDFLSDFVPNTDTTGAEKGSGEVPRFKHVESNYVKALEHGYIVEVQEISRIKDSGVLVGLNEYDRAGAIIPLVDGSHARRHANALVIYTDNVGYNSCRPIDPSVIRRMAFIIDSYDLPKEKALARLELNTDVHNQQILEKCYNVWEKIREFCYDKGITDGSISQSELEMWVMAVKMDDYSNYRQNCIECVISKATNDMEEQEEILSSVVDLYL